MGRIQLCSQAVTKVNFLQVVTGKRLKRFAFLIDDPCEIGVREVGGYVGSLHRGRLAEERGVVVCGWGQRVARSHNSPA